MHNVYIVNAAMRDGGMIRQLPYLSDTSKQLQLLITYKQWKQLYINRRQNADKIEYSTW